MKARYAIIKCIKCGERSIASLTSQRFSVCDCGCKYSIDGYLKVKPDLVEEVSDDLDALRNKIPAYREFAGTQKPFWCHPTPKIPGVDWIAALLHAMGKIEGRVRLDKLVFLLKRKYNIGLPYEFKPYLHGPFCRDIFGDLASLEGKGIITAEGENPMSFSLTESGKREAERIFDGLPYTAKRKLFKLRKFNEMNLDNLLHFVYSNYPNESSSPETEEQERV